MGLSLEQALVALKRLGKGALLRLLAYEPVIGDEVADMGIHMAGRLTTCDRSGLWVEWLEGPYSNPGVQTLWPVEDYRYRGFATPTKVPSLPSF